jgi:hypothetical protein
MNSSEKKLLGFNGQASDDLSMVKEKAIRMHVMFLLVIVVFCFLYGIVDLAVCFTKYMNPV